jgi:alpha-maltose-1-phosphate synthase
VCELAETLRVTVLSAYPFHMIDQARQLHRAGVLERMITAVPRSRVGLPEEVVSTRLRWSALRWGARRLTSAADPLLNRAVIRDFDRWAGPHLGKPSVVNGLSGFATQTLALASSRGIRVFCDRGSWHILEQRRVLDDESERIGAPRHHFDSFMVERELYEYQLADRILVPSEAARESFLRQGINSEKLIKLPYGVDISAFSPPAQPPPPGGIVSVGTVGLRKGQYHLLKAFPMLHTREANLTLVGPVAPGWDGRLKLDQPGIRTTGPLSRAQVIAELRRASVFVLSSVEEGLAQVIAQAMACGLPVIATKATGAEELITDGVEGIVIPDPPSAEVLAQAMDALLSDVDRARAMGAAARRKVESFGGWDRYGRQAVTAFQEGHLQ